MIGMARGPIAAAMVGKTIGNALQNNELPVYIGRFGNSIDKIFVTAEHLKKEIGEKQYLKLPTGAIGLYTYYERLAQGLRQLMAGARKFGLNQIKRDDIAALTEEAAKISGIKYVMDIDKELINDILNI
jgi:hypothetical protein